ncbi:MAG TPA: GAF domain-containing protein [Candidatus Omnitrophica bacterium]|nr:GAF domain-containing protein [Candidatus Omnitrophota bacterium]
MESIVKWSGFFSLVVNLSLGYFVYLHNRKNWINISFGAMSLAIAFWSVGSSVVNVIPNKIYALWLLRWSYFFASILPFLFLLFFYFVVPDKKKNVLKVAFIISCVFSFFSFTPFFLKNIICRFPLYPTIYISSPGILYIPFVIYFSLAGLIGIKWLLEMIRKTKGYRQLQARYFLIATLVSLTAALEYFSSVFGLKKSPPMDDFILVIYFSIMSYAIIKHHLMDIKVAVTRAGIFAFVYSLVLGIPFIIGYLTKSWILPTAIMFFLATLGPLIYTHLRKKAEDLILAEQKKYQRILLQAAQGMVKVKDLKHLINLMVHIVTKAVRVDKAAVFRLDKEKNLYQLEAYRDREQFKKEEPLSPDHSLIKHLLATKEPLLLEEIPFVVKGRLSQEEISSFFKEHNFCLVVPSFTETTLLGFLALGSKPNNQVFTPDDINVFKILAQQASLAIENCQFIEEFQKTQEKIFRADKLATVGAMAEGVSHQMNNRLQVFAAIAGDLKDLVASTLKNNPNLEGKLKEDLQYCLKSLEKMEKNVTHSAQIIRGILNYARTEKDSSFRFLDIKEVIDIAVDLLGVKHNLKGFKLQIKASLNLPKVYGSNAQLSEAIFNLIDNAYEAIEDKETYYEVKDIPDQIEKQIIIEIEPLKNSLLIKIKDTGIGIKEENKPKIFVPFYTTKSSAKSGTGLGMYVVKRIIEENHKGKIWFESKYLQGTTFYVELPCRRV